MNLLFEPDGKGTYRIIGGVTKADGVLLAAAPNLLLACKLAKDSFWSSGTGNGECIFCATQDNDEHYSGCPVPIIEAAIAKAEGR